jgi:ABC-2 type transport system ATP-binding protein
MLMHAPKVMVLDEPTFGVDPVSRIELWEILNELRAEGISLIVSTPYMDEAERCDRIGLINHGRLLGLDMPENIIKNFNWPVYRIRTDKPHVLYNKLIHVLNEQDTQLYANGVHIIDRNKKGLNNLKKELQEKIDIPIQPEKIQPGMENIFLDLMQRQNVENE